MSLRVVIASDDAGREYQKVIESDLRSDPRVAEVLTVPEDDPDQAYPSIAVAAAKLIAAGQADAGILICGTGMGMAIAANKVPGIRACTAHDSFSVERLVLSNDAQILTLGERVIGLQLARRLAKEFLGYTFDPASPSAEKVAQIERIERELLVP